MRNQNMDVIRGLAVLGLMYMNVYSFGLFELGYVSQINAPFSDQVIQWLNLVFIDGRFRTLFCLLFGAGLYLQWQYFSLIQPLKKRLKVLAICGLLHGFLLWAGDILFIYACAGWVVLNYLDAENDLLLKRSWQFIAMGSVISFIVTVIEPSVIVYRDTSDFIMRYEENRASIATMVLDNSIMFAIMLLAVPLITMWMAAGLMLLGVYSYKQKIFEKGITQSQFRKMILLTVLATAARIAVEFQLAGFMSDALKEPINWLAALAMAVLIIHSIIKINGRLNSVFSILQQVGRLAFTLYIMQTILLLLFFKVFYPEWVLTFNRIDYCMVVTVLVLLQVVFSVVYRHCFSQGPLEYCWRKLAR